MTDQSEPQRNKGIKIKELAKELGLTSRELIDRCRSQGLSVQNSITKLNRNTEGKIRAWFKDKSSDSAPEE